MKKIKYIVYTIMLFIAGIGVSYAASLSVSANKKTVTVGSTVTVTVNASGAAGWEYCIAYDSSMFTLTKATSDTGGACVRTGSTLTGYSSVTYTFKANKSGSSTISLRSAVMYGDDGNEISSSKGSVTLTAKTQAEIEASYSTNADLKDLSVEGYTISPTFSKNELEYELEVENDVESVNITASKADGNASVSGAGKVTLSEGMNKVEIVVTAQKGNKKTYVLNITRKELNPITVKVDGKEYNVVRKSENLEVPTYYSSTTIKINDEDIPAFESEITGFTLVGLKDEDGNVKLYRYDNGEYTLYNQIAKDSFVFIPLSNSEVIKGFDNKRSVKINDVDIEVYSANEENDIVLVYGMNASSGDKNWYLRHI
ncbi:MAG: cadherin-like beta sandwich domain-containing protein [Bacilli bacterium]|nr:cadherin-like beta sandwich domain-containing protein [Bacilli bacterium]